MSRPYDAFQMSVSHTNIDGNENALELTKQMLRRENELRLSDETRLKYFYAETSRDVELEKTRITVLLQEQVVKEFLNCGTAHGLFETVKEGLCFLRGAVGNFPSHLEELRACAKYVHFTQHCRRGHLRIGDVLEDLQLQSIRLFDPETAKQTETLWSQFKLANNRPIVIVSSSSS